MIFKIAYRILVLMAMTFIALAFSGCSKSGEPSHLEPIISDLEVDEVSRTSARLSAMVENRGNGSFERFHFVITGDGDIEIRTEDIDRPSGKVVTTVAGLRPGCEYRLYAEGVRNNAVVKSETLSFFTLPNDPPTISALSVVAAGPTAAILEFDVVSDGGERVYEAGCYLKRSGETSSVNIEAYNLSESKGTYLVHINSLEKHSDYVISPYAVNSVGETVGDEVIFSITDAVSLSRPGDLGMILKDDELTDDTLSISGYMNGDDFRCVRRLAGAPVISGADYHGPYISHLDISDVVISAGGASYDGSRFTEPDIITTGLFASCDRLESVALPLSVHTIQRNAFSGSRNLKSLTVPAMVSSLSPSADCDALERIDVSEGNATFNGHDGVVFNSGMTEIVWFPHGKSGEFIVPAMITEIGEEAFASCRIEKVILPNGVHEIGRNAFAGSMLREIMIPDNVRNIREGLFQNCGALKRVELGTSVESVGDYVFDNCMIDEIRLHSSIPPYVSANALSNNLGLLDHCKLIVPSGSKPIYRNHSWWGRFNSISEIE